MITLSIGKLLEDNGFGTLVLTGQETGDDLIFHEKLPDGKTGVYIISNGDPLDKSLRAKQSFDLYARGVNDLAGAKWLEQILMFFANECWPVCDLPAVDGYTEQGYKNCVIKPTSNIQNVGQDDTNRNVFVCTAEIKYNLKEQ